MTSLELFQPVPNTVAVPPEWGTGRMKENKIENLWIPRAPTWHYDGKPTEQDYTLTQLKLSNVRVNDQLVDNPQHVTMDGRIIELPYPAEHPYASHQPQKAIFPNFDSPYDPKTGVKARKLRPIHPEIPAQPHNVVVVSKTKGSALRYEEQEYDHASKREPLKWLENNFDQIPKGPAREKQRFYPTPTKTYVPNLEERDDSKVLRGHMVTSARTSNALRNVAREQWQTQYDRHYTGLGPATAMNLDNYEDKKMAEARDNTHGHEVDQLKPRAVNTFDPARPKEGRIMQTFTPAPPPQTNNFPAYQKDPSYARQMTLTEKEEHRLHHGGQYVNLPSHRPDSDWQKFDETHPNLKPENPWSYMGQSQAAYYPHEQTAAGAEPEAGSGLTPTERARIAHHNAVQQVEAEGRWKVLEGEKPGSNLTGLRNKLETVPPKEHPQVFYSHEGQYQTERAGMYQTSYDPYKLQYEMNKLENSGGYKFDLSKGDANLMNMPIQLPTDKAEIMRYNRTFGGSRSVPPGLSNPTPFEAVEPFEVAKMRQKSALQPKATTADPRTQEGRFIQTESEMGENYNTQKFLQEYSLNEHTRNNPQHVMSSENSDLNVVRQHSNLKGSKSSSKRVRFSLETRSSPQPTNQVAPEATTQLTSTRFEPLDLATSLDLPQPYMEPRDTRHSGFHTARPGGNPMATNLFASKSSNITAPSGLNFPSQYKSTYQTLQSKATPLVDLSFKQDERFDWRVGSGRPRPQTSLLNLQNGFVKSDVRKKFLQQFPERNPDLRENIILGKKHSFLGMNAQILRGTEVGEDC